jgi:hypothetical protein
MGPYIRRPCAIGSEADKVGDADECCEEEGEGQKRSSERGIPEDEPGGERQRRNRADDPAGGIRLS